MTLYPPNITIVTPTATPPAIKNCGLASSAKIAGEPPLSAASTPGPILLSRLLISASVSATAAIASGFACSVAMMVAAECWIQCASSMSLSSLVMRPLSSASLPPDVGERWKTRSSG